jgi:hypothetical protein
MPPQRVEIDTIYGHVGKDNRKTKNGQNDLHSIRLPLQHMQDQRAAACQPGRL